MGFGRQEGRRGGRGRIRRRRKRNREKTSKREKNEHQISSNTNIACSIFAEAVEVGVRGKMKERRKVEKYNQKNHVLLLKQRRRKKRDSPDDN